MSHAETTTKPATAKPAKASTTTTHESNITMNTSHTSLGTTVLEIAGLEVTLPVKFGPGHILTENQAKVLDAAFQRQFTNNQNALAKSRSEAFAKAATDAERAAKAPLTASQIAALYTDYEPSVGGATRASSMEKIRADAAWRFWTKHVTSHNEAVAAGHEPVIVKAGKTIVALPTGKGAADKREALTTALLARKDYADRIQMEVDAILAEKGKAKEAAPVEAIAASVDLF